MVEVNCETDFVANTDEFKQLCADIVQAAHAAAPIGITNIETDAALLESKHAGGTLGDFVKAASAKTGEAVAFRRVAKFAVEGGVVGVYRHFNGLVGVSRVKGSGTGITSTGVHSRLNYQVDNGFMSRLYVGEDGRKHRGTFAFV